jgi:hypothetical protein
MPCNCHANLRTDNQIRLSMCSCQSPFRLSMEYQLYIQILQTPSQHVNILALLIDCICSLTRHHVQFFPKNRCVVQLLLFISTRSLNGYLGMKQIQTSLGTAPQDSSPTREWAIPQFATFTCNHMEVSLEVHSSPSLILSITDCLYS